MLKHRIIPVLLIERGRLVKTVKFKNPTYVGDPINAVKIFNDKEVDEICVIDISATKEGREPNYALIEELAGEAFMPFAYGGGISSVAQARKILALGAEKIVVKTHALERPDFIKELADSFGSQSVVVVVDVKKDFLGRLVVHHSGRGRPPANSPLELAKRFVAEGAGEIILQSVDRDGTMKGYDLDLIRSISSEIEIPLIAVGGAGSSHDLHAALAHGGAAAAGAGSIFVFYGKHRAVLISYPDSQTMQEILNTP